MLRGHFFLLGLLISRTCSGLPSYAPFLFAGSMYLRTVLYRCWLLRHLPFHPVNGLPLSAESSSLSGRDERGQLRSDMVFLLLLLPIYGTVWAAKMVPWLRNNVTRERYMWEELRENKQNLLIKPPSSGKLFQRSTWHTRNIFFLRTVHGQEPVSSYTSTKRGADNFCKGPVIVTKNFLLGPTFPSLSTTIFVLLFTCAILSRLTFLFIM